MAIQIEKFNILSIKNDSKIIIIGKRSTGKTTLVNNIISHLTIDKFNIFNSYANFRNEYQSNKNNYIEHLEYTENIIDDTVLDKNYTNMIIIDNCLYDQKQLSIVSQLYNLFTKEKNIGIILTLSYGLFINKNINTSAHYIFIFNEKNPRNIKYLYINYFNNLFTSFEEFTIFFKEVTREKYTALVICNNIKSKNIEDIVFLYKINDG